MPSTRPINAWQLLRVGGFRRLLLVRLLGQFGDGLLQVGLASFVFFSPERAATPDRIAAGFAVLLLPFSLVGPFAGVLLDRWSRQRILVLANLARAVLLIALTAQVATSSETPAFYLTALLLLGLNRFILAALSASLPKVVRRRELVLANAVAVTAGTVATLIGATCGAVLRHGLGGNDLGTSVVTFTAAIVCTAAAAAAMRFTRPALGPYPPTTVRLRYVIGDVARSFAGGVTHLRTRPKATRALGVMTGHRFLYGMATVIGILLFRNTFFPHDVDAAFVALGAAVAAAGLGVLTGALLTPPVTRRIGTTAWTCTVLFIAAPTQLILGFAHRTWAVVVASFILGAVAQAVKIGVDSTLQRQIDDQHRGRVFTIYDLLFNVAYVAAAAFAALAMPPSGRAPALAFGLGLGYLALGLWYSNASGDAETQDASA